MELGRKIFEFNIKLGIYSFSLERNSKRYRIYNQIQKKTKLGILIFLGFLIFDFTYKFFMFPKGGEFDLESFIFQATMPGLTEEILFRGIYLWLLRYATHQLRIDSLTPCA